MVSYLGGYNSTKYDIFIILSMDSTDAFKSTNHAFWPVLCIILNLPPSIRFKMNNLLLVSFIPGPSNPEDTIYFLKPSWMRWKNNILVLTWFSGIKKLDTFESTFFLQQQKPWDDAIWLQQKAQKFLFHVFNVTWFLFIIMCINIYTFQINFNRILNFYNLGTLPKKLWKLVDMENRTHGSVRYSI